MQREKIISPFVFVFGSQTTLDRVLPLWHGSIAPDIKSGKKVVIAAHGNSLRALVKYLDNISDKEITELNIPTGVPLHYELDENLKPIAHKDAIGPLSVCIRTKTGMFSHTITKK